MKTEKMFANIKVADYVAKYVDVDKFKAKCEECDNHKKKCSCPPFDFDPIKLCNSFDKMTVYGLKVTLDKDDEDDVCGTLKKAKKQLDDYLLELELELTGAYSLSAGSCELCGDEPCTRSSDEPCRKPERMRYSIEAIGGDVSRTSKDLLKTEILWGDGENIPEYYMLVGAILIADDPIII